MYRNVCFERAYKDNSSDDTTTTTTPTTTTTTNNNNKQTKIKTDYRSPFQSTKPFLTQFSYIHHLRFYIKSEDS